MLKKIIMIFIVSLLAGLVSPSVTFAAFQIGIETQIKKDNQYSIDTANLNWWFTDNLALRSDYSWNTGELGLATLYRFNPESRASLYLGIAGQDLNGAVTPEAPMAEKLQLITGVEFALSRNSNWSMMVEAGINPNDFNGSTTVNHELSSKLGVSLNYRFPQAHPANEAETNLYLLAKLVTLEARDEPFAGQVAVAAVVLNRKSHPDFPDSIPAVIYEPGQFAPARSLSGTKPTESALRAAKQALEGSDPSHGALYFYNPARSSARARKYIRNSNFEVTARIGKHVFYR